MAICNYYPVSGTVVDQDLFLGTKSGNNNTVNYTAQTVANYLNTNSKIAIGGQISFRFDTVPSQPKTIFFAAGGGDNTPFSSITSLMVSSMDASGADITIFLNYLNGSEILLSQQNQPNNFGHYKILSYSPIISPGFSTLQLQYIGGNGNITENTYYDLNSFVLSSVLGGYVPDTRTISTITPLQGGGDLSANRTLSILQSSSLQDGYLSSADWTMFNNKQSAITLTTTGSSGPATLVGSTINVPDYSAGITVPTLDQVLTAGNTSILAAKIGVLYGYDNVNSDYGTLEFYDSGIVIKAATTNHFLFYNDDSGTVQFSNGAYNPTLNFAGVGNNIYTFQNSNGTLAFTSDIPSLAGYVPTSRTLTINGTLYDLTADRSWSVGTVTSVGLSMPSAFTVSSSPVTGSGTIAVAGAGVASQYIRGDGTLANFPTSTGGGASVSYYLNGSVSQGTIGGVAYKEMNGVPVIGAGTDFTINANGYIAQFITDVGDPNKLLIPAGNWNFETYFSASSGGGSPRFYIELYKYDGSTFTLISSNSATPENITGGTSIDLYFTALAIPPTTLLATDRLAVRFYVIHSGRTITMHTENSHLSQIITTFSTGLTALNGLTTQVQYFAVGTAGTDFNISSVTDTHTFNLPTASATNRGALSSADWTTFNGKFNLPSLTSGSVLFSNGTTIAQDNANFFWHDTNNRLGIGTNTPSIKLQVETSVNGSDGIWIRNTNTGTLAVGSVDCVSNVGSINLRAHSSTHSPWANTSMISSASAFSGGMVLFQGGANPISFWTNSSEKMRITSAGNIGIGTTTPTAKLHIVAPGALSTDIALSVRNSADTSNLMLVRGNGVYLKKIYITNEDTVGNYGVYLASGGAGSFYMVNDTYYSGYPSAFSQGGGGFSFSETAEYIGGDQDYHIKFQKIFRNTNLAVTQNQNYKFLNNIYTINNSLTSTGTATGIFLNATETALNGMTHNLIDLQVGGISNFIVKNNGNVGIGMTPTAKLTIKAPGALSTDIALRVRNSADTADLLVTNGLGNVGIGTSAPTVKLQVASVAGDITKIGQTTTNVGSVLSVTGYAVQAGVAYFANNNGACPATFSIFNDIYAHKLEGYYSTSNNANTSVLGLLRTFAQTSGTSTDNMLAIVPTLNLTGTRTASLVRGIYYNPILTSLTGTSHRAIETVTGDVILGSTSGNVGIGTTTPTAKLHIVAPGALSTDIALSVRNSAGSGDLMTVNGLGNVGIGSIVPDVSALLEVGSTTKGFLPPRMTNAQRIAIASPAVGLMVYCTNATEGLYINKSTGWTFIG